MSEAFGAPGIPPTWTSSTKDLVTRSLGPARLWATLGQGIVNADAIPALRLEPGKPTESAMPLVGAHAELLKLLVAREQGIPWNGWTASGAATPGGDRPRQPGSGGQRFPSSRCRLGRTLVIED